MWWLGLIIAAVAAVLRRLNVAAWPGAAPFVVFPGLLYNAVLVATRRQLAALAAGVLGAAGLFLAPPWLPVEAAAGVVAWAAGWACMAVEAMLVTQAAHRWAGWAGGKCQDPAAHAWRAGVLAVSGAEALLAALLFARSGWTGAAAGAAAAAGVAHNVVHPRGVVLSATSSALFAAVCLAASGGGGGWAGGWAAGQLSPLALGLLAPRRRAQAALLLLLALYARADLRTAEALLVLLLAPATLVAQDWLEP